MMTRYSPAEKCMLRILSSTGRTNIRSMAQLQQLPMLYRELVSHLHLMLRQVMCQASIMEAMHQTGVKPQHAEMKAVQSLLFRKARFADLCEPIIPMDRILALACTEGAEAALRKLQCFVNSTCRRQQRAV